MRVLESAAGGHATAEAIAAGANLAGKLAVITGGSSGIGFETARSLAGAGATVFIGGQDAAKLADAADRLRAPGHTVHARQLDLMEIASVDAFANAVLALGRPVDLLIANAGIMATPLRRTPSGVESQFMTNVVGHAILLSRLAGALSPADDGRFISLSSTAHHLSPVLFDDLQFARTPYDPWVAYGQSKSGSALLAVRAAAALGPRGIAALAVHPGMIQTGLTRHLAVTDIAESTRLAEGDAADAMIALFKDIPHGAATTVWAAVEPTLRGRGPLYLEDTRIAEPIDRPNRTHGVMPHVLDPAAADRLWSEIEAIAGRDLPL